MEGDFYKYALLGLRTVLVSIYDKETVMEGLRTFEAERMRGQFYLGRWCLCGMVAIPGLMYPKAFAEVMKSISGEFPFDVQFSFSCYVESSADACRLMENKSFLNLDTQADEALKMIKWVMPPMLERNYPSMVVELSKQKIDDGVD